MRPLSEIRNYMGNYHVKSGVYHYYRKEFKQALGFLRKALADELSLDEGERRNARCYLALSLKGLADKLAANGEPEQALEELKSAVEVQGNYPDLHFGVGTLLEQLGRLEEAIAVYRKALECHPRYVDASVALARCLALTGQTDEAAEAYEQAMEMRIEALRRPFDEGLDLLREGERARALEQFHRVFLSVPRLSDVYLGQALDAMKAEDWERALADLERAIDLNPAYPDLHNFRGIALCEASRPTEAVGGA